MWLTNIFKKKKKEQEKQENQVTIDFSTMSDEERNEFIDSYNAVLRHWGRYD